MDIPIIYEDEYILAINKPAGFLVHSDGRPNGSTLVDWIKENRPEIMGTGESLTLSDGTVLERPGIVHRLDQDTSGALVVAKTHDVFLYLKEQFQMREVEKIYHAFVYGKIKNTNGLIDRPIGRSASDFRKWSAQRGARGTLRNAITEYKVLKTTDEWSFVEARPRTGRTHQIRVHFKAVNHPIVCDKLYAPNHECLLGFHRIALHSLSISITLPNGQKKIIEAEYPVDFVMAIRTFSDKLDYS